MAHNILGNRFYNRSSKPAWHGLGLNVEDGTLNAEEALRALGLFDVLKKPLYHVNNEGLHEETGFYGLFREPIAEDFSWRMLGTPVTSDYELITPITAARLWDEHVRNEHGGPVPVETVGILGKGERLFITTRLPGYDVAGDEVESYLFFDNPLENNVYIGGYVTPVRVVCQNTLMMGISAARQQFRVSHDPGVTALMGEWLGQVYQQALFANQVMAEAARLLAKQPVSDTQVKWIAEGAYPTPRMNDDDPRARRDITERQQRFEYLKELNDRSRELAVALFQGGGTGMDTPAANGTAWGAYNAVAELETYRRGTDGAALTGCLTGERGERMRRAFTLALNAGMHETHTPAEALAELRYAEAVPVNA